MLGSLSKNGVISPRAMLREKFIDSLFNRGILSKKDICHLSKISLNPFHIDEVS
jgi:hypothetical protein